MKGTSNMNCFIRILIFVGITAYTGNYSFALPQQSPNCTDISRPELCTPGTNVPVIERPAKDDRRVPIEPNTIERGIDRPGLDFRSFNLTTSDPRVCQSACRNDKKCAAWTYVRAGIQGSTPRCWLKTATPEPRKSDCCTSGEINRR